MTTPCVFMCSMEQVFCSLCHELRMQFMCKSGYAEKYMQRQCKTA